MRVQTFQQTLPSTLDRSRIAEQPRASYFDPLTGIAGIFVPVLWSALGLAITAAFAPWLSRAAARK